MPPISLDDVIHYSPPTIQSNCEPVGKSNMINRFAPSSSWNKAVQASSFLPSRPPVGSHWSSKHAPDMRNFSDSSGGSKSPSILDKPATDESPSHLNDFDSEFSKVSQNKDTNAILSSVCSTERDPRVDFNTCLQQGISERYLRGPEDTEHYESASKLTQDTEAAIGLRNLPLPDASIFVPDSDELGLPGEDGGVFKEIELSGPSDSSNMHTIDWRQMDPIVNNSNRSVAINGENLALANEETHDSQSHSPNCTQSLASEIGTMSDKASSKLPTCDIDGSRKAKNHSNKPVTEVQLAANHDADEVTDSDQQDWSQRNSEDNLPACSKEDGDSNTARPVSLSFQCNKRPQCNFPARYTRSSPALEPPSVVIINSRSQVPQSTKSDLAPRKSSKRHCRSEVSCEINSDENNEPSDSDYVHDRGDVPRESSTIPHRTKRVRRAAPARAQYAVPNSANAAKSLDVPEDQTPLTSLRDVETIPVRGFLTRQILLSKVVYSFTVEEQFEHSCVRASGGIPSNSRKQVGSRPTKPHHPEVSRAGATTRPSRVLSEDDQLLIELKEDRGLPWKEIAEYFPERSKGSLQVRYCTRLKSRHAGGFSRRKSIEKCVSKERYGPPRRRRIVDRYSPV